LKLKGMLARTKKPRYEEGASLVELAILMGVFGPVLLLGTFEVSALVFASVELSDATHAAASYAAQYYMSQSSPALPTQAQVTAAATNDAPELLNMLPSGGSLSVSMATGCGTGSASAGNAVPSCSSGTLPYVQITTTATVAPIVKFLNIASFPMTSQATVNLVN
jgi:Flp pilus assembly protein TadG